MILDTWENRMVYQKLNPFYIKGLAFAETLKDQPGGRYEYEDGIFALVQTGRTDDISETPFECHRKYLDLQWVCEGSESIMWSPLPDTETVSSYVPDVELRSGEGSRIVVRAGQFYLMFPQDAHKCCGNVGARYERSVHFKKIVLKLPYTEE